MWVEVTCLPSHGSGVADCCWLTTVSPDPPMKLAVIVRGKIMWEQNLLTVFQFRRHEKNSTQPRVDLSIVMPYPGSVITEMLHY